jgi:murein DD-endopeptidase MepM/ murein hydrolase activator NlpD
MHPIRNFRRTRGLTIVELAQQSGISARELGECELGIATLAPDVLERIAAVLELPAALLKSSLPARATPAGRIWRQAAAATVLTAAALAVTSYPANHTGTTSMRRSPGVGQVLAASRLEPTAAALEVAEFAQWVSASVAPTRLPEAPGVPALAAASTALPLSAALPSPGPEPRGCPLLAAPERIVVTQGYDVGSHTPARAWGAIDLGIDIDGDGIAEPDSTRDVVVLATHSGVAKVYPETWPGGKVVRIVDDASGWATLYAHLDTIGVAEGQLIVAGQPIGTVGTTGDSTGPHLHYEVWSHTENLNPTGFVECAKSS